MTDSEHGTYYCYLDGIDFQHHLEADVNGTKLYPSEKALRADTGHSLDECGIVRVKVVYLEWIVPQNLKLNKWSDDKGE